MFVGYKHFLSLHATPFLPLATPGFGSAQRFWQKSRTEVPVFAAESQSQKLDKGVEDQRFSLGRRWEIIEKS